MNVRFFLLLLVSCFLPALARAHIGSPIIVFDGQAGTQPLRVIIRPPSVIPGRAEIDVRFLSEVGEKTRVTVLPVSAGIGLKGAPPPDEAVPVRGDPSLRHAELWLMTPGAYSVHVEITGGENSGKLIVPVMAVAIQQPTMSPALKVILGSLGCLLFCSAVTLVGLGGRESTLPPGAAPSARAKQLGYLAIVATLLMCALGVYWGKKWWDREDLWYRSNQMYRPVPMAAKTRVEQGQRLVQLTLASGLPSTDTRTAPLIPDHGKLMHLFMIREPQLDAFAHVHPLRVSGRNFDLAVPPLPKGTYRLYADVTFENGFSSTLTTTVDLPDAPEGQLGDSHLAVTPDSDDSWSVSSGDHSSTAAPIALKNMTKDELRVGHPVSLEFAVVDQAGEPAEIEPYMGMQGHAAVRRSDGTVFAHLHPVGTISMASQQYFEKQAARQTSASTAMTEADHSTMDHAHMHHHMGAAATTVSFPYEFPVEGNYRLWVQTKVQGNVVTGVFDLEVGPKK